MERRSLKVESLEERTLMAVMSGLDMAPSMETFSAELTSAHTGLKEGDVYIQSTIDIDGDGFIGPGDQSYLSTAWFSNQSDENWNPACDIDGDGFIGPGDSSFVSAHWFETNDILPEETKSYEIVPADLSNWLLKGETSRINAYYGTLTLDARNGVVESICPYDNFGSDLRVTAEFQATEQLAGIQCGIELAAHENGERYRIIFEKSNVYICYIDSDGVLTQLSQRSASFSFSKWYTVWAQISDGQIACGVGEKVYLTAYDNHLTSGRVGFFADKGSEQFRNIFVQRNPEKVTPDGTKNYITVATGSGGLVCSQFPDVCRLQDGTLMAVVYTGYSHVSYPSEMYPKGGKICSTFSYDDGRTWTPLKTVVDTELDDRDPSIVQLDDGRILCNFFVLDTDQNGDTLLRTKLTESKDGGKTWSEPVDVYVGYAVSTPIRVLSNGSLIMPLYRQADDTAWGAVGISYDQGKSWEPAVTIPRGKYRLDAETDVIERTDGSLYAIQRTQMGYSISRDYGLTWSTSEDVGFQGECPYLLRAPNGIVLLALREQSKTTLRVSTDDCSTWSNAILVDNCHGAYASIVERYDGSFLILYYEGGESSNIRARCFSLDDRGNITWNLL